MSSSTRGPSVPRRSRQAARASAGRRVHLRIPAGVRELLCLLGRRAEALGVSAYAVGGCVRDWLLGHAETPDLDLTITGDGIAFARAVAPEIGARLVVHEPFGTASLMEPRTIRVAGGTRGRAALRIDVAGCRRESRASRRATTMLVSSMTWGTQVLLPQALRILQRMSSQRNNAIDQPEGPGRYAGTPEPFNFWKHNVHVLIHPLHSSYHDCLSFLSPPTRQSWASPCSIA